MNLVVISTARNPTPAQRERCEASVRCQTFPAAQHLYLDGDAPHLEKLYHTIHALHPSDVVCSLDGDDAFYWNDALAIVARAYEAGAWMTWGQYRQIDEGRPVKPGIARDVPDRRMCRRLPWFASHLKTYRAGLFQQIKSVDLQWVEPDCTPVWLPQCCDLAVMFPMLEMAAERGRFLPQVIYNYDYTDRRLRGVDVNGTPLFRQRNACERHVRSLPVYPRLERAPW